MFRVLEPLLILLAKATDQELARMLEYLKEENQILRSKLPKRIIMTVPEEKRLLNLGKKLGSAGKRLITIVSYRTFCQWLGGEGSKKRDRQPGRPKKPEEIRDLVLHLARETDWGYTCIFGELKKLGIHSVCRSTIVNLLKENGLDPGPKRGKGTWDEFLKRHAQSLWACDFFSQKILTWKGMVDVFALFFIHIGTRRVFLAGPSERNLGRAASSQLCSSFRRAIASSEVFDYGLRYQVYPAISFHDYFGGNRGDSRVHENPIAMRLRRDGCRVSVRNVWITFWLSKKNIFGT